VGPMAPADASTHFGGTPTPSLAPMIVYPNDHVLVPPNLRDLEFQWHPQGTDQIYDLHFHSNYLDLHIYLGTNRYVPSADEWSLITDSHRGDDVTYEVLATPRASGGGVGTSQARTLGVSIAKIEGALYYWAAPIGGTSDSGIWRYDFMAGGAAENYYTLANY